MSFQRILGLITAREGSKGIPDKNLQVLDEKPLIAWSIQAACRSKYIHRVIVSTDGPNIRQAALDFGAEAPFLRPSELAQDDSPHILCVLHALDWLATHEDYHPDAVCLLQPTSPFRTEEDIDKACGLFSQRKADAVVSVSASDEHPFFAKKMTADARLIPFIERRQSYDRRQDLPSSFHINGAVYVNRVSSLLRDQTFYPENLLASVMPRERSLDINTPWDLRIAKLLVKEGGQ